MEQLQIATLEGVEGEGLAPPPLSCLHYNCQQGVTPLAIINRYPSLLGAAVGLMQLYTRLGFSLCNEKYHLWV